MVKLLTSLTIEAPADAPAAELKLVLDQLRGVVLPVGWAVEIGTLRVRPDPMAVRADDPALSDLSLKFPEADFTVDQP